MPPLYANILTFILTTLLCACGGGTTHTIAYSAFHHIPSATWNADNEIHFALSSKADSLNITPGNYRLIINLRHTVECPYSEIWLTLNYLGLKQKEKTDTIKISLTDASGRWKGEGTRTLRLVADTITQPIYIDPAWQISLRHAMKPISLQGIQDVGITLIKE